MKLEFSADLYFSMVSKEKIGLCEDAMTGLIARYGLEGAEILSLGAGESFEEFWFQKCGARLTLNDIELKVDPDRCVGAGLSFLLGPAEDELQNLKSPGFDLLYVSSFHPDEIRRDQIQADFIARRTAEQAYHHVTWPENAQPYLSTLMTAVEKVKKGGLIIFQHYRGGVSIDSNPHYVDAVRKQIRAAGAEVLEIYTFKRSTPHLLVVARKGGRMGGWAKSRSLRKRPEISTFHGRYGDKSISTEVVKAFDLAKRAIRPEKVFGRHQ